jgi:hypothetical protein
MKEYRIVYKRHELKPKRKLYKSLRGVRRFLLLLGDEPWKAFGRDPDEFYCCDGHYCRCGGKTVREDVMDRYKEIPLLEWVKIEEREVGEFKEIILPQSDANPIEANSEK